eukprot:jgi/Bigna1/39386/e_gw1.32.118.1
MFLDHDQVSFYRSYLANVQLLEAVEQGDLQAVEKELKEGADVNIPHEDGCLPLEIATKGGGSKQLEIIRCLIAASAQVNIPNNDGKSPLRLAVESADLNLVKDLVSAKADLEGGSNLNDDKEVVASLLRAGAKPDLHDKSRGCYPLNIAASNKNARVLRLLLSAGADVEKHDHEGKTALSIAAAMDDLGIVRLLVQDGKAVADSQDVHGRTPLMHAAASGNMELVTYLIDEAQADIELECKAGKRAGQYATGRVADYFTAIVVLSSMSSMSRRSSRNNAKKS